MSWWKEQSSATKAGVLIGALCLGMILVVAIAGMMAPDNSQTGVEPVYDTTTYDNDSSDVSGASSTKTFEGSGISFSYPTTWNIYTPDESGVDSVVYLASEDMVSVLAVYSGPALGDLETLKDTWIEVCYECGDDVNYVKETTVDGNMAYIIGSSTYDPEIGECEMECVLFNEGNYYYKLLFSSKDLSTIRDDMDTIIYSFRVD